MDFEFSCFFVAVAGLALVVGSVAVLLWLTTQARVSGMQKQLLRMEWELGQLRAGRTNAARPAEPSAAPPSAIAPPVPQTMPVPHAAPAPVAGAGARGPVVPPPQPAVSPVYGQRPAVFSAAVAARASNAQDMASLESKIGQRWIAWVGAIVVFLSVVFFLKYAFQNEWIGPTGQVVISALGGVLVAAAGSYFCIVKKWRIFGQCLMGLGLAILYASFYGAFQLYDPPVMGQTPAFAFMIAVTVAGMTLAVLHDAVSMAFLAVLGGILTPVLVSTGQDSRDTLFAYMVLLDLGVMGVAFYRGWRLLDTLAMAGSFIMYAGWWGKFYTAGGLWPAVAWLGAFYVIFLLLPFVYHLARKQVVTVERFVMAVANAAFAASFAWWMLREDYLFTMGFVCLGMAAAYLALGVLLRARVPSDARALLGAITMTVTFITLAVPMQLHAHGILLAWVAEAPVLAFLAYRFNYQPLRWLAFGVLVVAVERLFLSATHWPMHSEAFVPFANKQFLSAMTVPAAVGLYAVAHQVYAARRTAADVVLQVIAGLGAGLLALIVLHAEIHGWVGYAVDGYAAGCAVTALWAAGAMAYTAACRWVKGAHAALWGMAFLLLLVGGVLGTDVYQSHLGAGHLLFINARFGAWLLLLAATFGLAWMIRRDVKGPESQEAGMAVFVLVGGLAVSLVLLSTEAYTFCWDVILDSPANERAGQMSITLVWSLYAAGLLWVGFWRRWRWVRYAGLGLFGLAALKLLIYDLSYLKDVYRIVSFLVLGVLMLAASYFYHRLEKRLAIVEEKAPEAAEPTGDGA